uniref:Uncharacterized protein n=1 Tax=Anguilla anguilla TaxID=7936 RepID=A0A0E9RWN9_ANGAN
MQCVSVSLISV